jgi:superfamily II RNA helicase
MQLIPDLFHPSLFTLWTAPVASGKTRTVVEFYRQNDFKIVYLSPLRALANEVHEQLSLRGEKHVFLAGGEMSLDVCLEKFLSAKKSFLVTTAELLSDEFIEELWRIKEKVLFVIDEFHLFYYWGESFRPVLHERFLSLLNCSLPVLAITATMTILSSLPGSAEPIVSFNSFAVFCPITRLNSFRTKEIIDSSSLLPPK